MSNVQNMVVNYLDAARIMHVATAGPDGLWCSAVYFATDNNHTIYWLSDPEARHSRDIAHIAEIAEGGVATVAAAITLPQDYRMPRQGLQVTGQVKEIPIKETESLYQSYAERFVAHGVVDDMLAGRDKRRLYQLTPAIFVLYDEKFFPDQPRQEWRLDGSSPEAAAQDVPEQESLAIDDQAAKADIPSETAPRDEHHPEVPPIIDPINPRDPF